MTSTPATQFQRRMKPNRRIRTRFTLPDTANAEKPSPITPEEDKIIHDFVRRLARQAARGYESQT